MFGYVVVNKPELKFKEFDIYRGYYCGLCHSLRSRHGITGQLTLTYDMTFLAMLLSSLYDTKKSEEMLRCIAHPFRKHLSITTEYTDYVADMNILLAYYKSIDDWKDERSLLKLSFSKLIRHSNESYGKKADLISSLIDELSKKEEEGETNIDVVSGIFGKIMAILFVPKEDVWSKKLERIGFFLGKFIYILDAYDDIPHDIKKHNYNPFVAEYKKPGFDDKIKSMLTMMMAECSKTFEALPIIEDADILRNILYAGVWSAFYNGKNDKNDQKPKVFSRTNTK